MKRGSQVLYLCNPNGEAEVLQYYYVPGSVKKLKLILILPVYR
jgi:hypothetical protein